MFHYQFPVSPYTVDLKEMRGEYDPVPEPEDQLAPPAASSWRTKLARTLHSLAVRLDAEQCAKRLGIGGQAVERGKSLG